MPAGELYAAPAPAADAPHPAATRRRPALGRRTLHRPAAHRKVPAPHGI
jgi:hypothetical protein